MDKNLSANVFTDFSSGLALLCAGEAGHFNAMTIGWGGMGTLWRMPVCTVYVRESRYTYDFMNDSEYFTVSFYDPAYKEDMGVMGSLSGRDGDKIAKTKLTPKPLEHGVTFAEARRTLVCRKLFAADLDPAAMPADIREKFYGPGETDHHMFIGEVVEVL